MVARASRRTMGRVRWPVGVVDPEVARFVDLERGTPEQICGLCFMTTVSMRIPAVCVPDELTTLHDQPPRLGEISGIGLTGMYVGCDGK